MTKFIADLITVNELPFASWLLCHGIPFLGEEVHGTFVSFKFRQVPEYEAVRDAFLRGDEVKISDFLQAYSNLRLIISQHRKDIKSSSDGGMP